MSAFLLAAVLAAWAPTGTVFLVALVALVVEGLCTSLMLIAAAPALVTGWPVKKMPGHRRRRDTGGRRSLKSSGDTA